MQISRNNLENFNLYPFITLGINDKGLIFYKNKITEKLCPQIRNNTLINRFTTASIDKSAITSATFYDNRSTLLVHKLDDELGEYTVITVFSGGSGNGRYNENYLHEYCVALDELLIDNEGDIPKNNQLGLIRNIQKLQKALTDWGNFTTSFIDNCHNKLSDTNMTESFFTTVTNVVNNRLRIGVELELINNTEEINATFGFKTAVTLLNVMGFIFLNSTDKHVTISFDDEAGGVKVGFVFNSKYDIESLYGFKGSYSTIFTLLTGVTAAKNFGIEFDFTTNDKNQTLFNVHVPSETGMNFAFMSSSSVEAVTNTFCDEILYSTFN